MSRVVLLLGSNLEDRVVLLSKATSFIERGIGGVIKQSSIYESEPWGFASENSFLNQAILLKTDKTPEITLQKCLEIEKELGRVRKSTKNYSDRSIDIDILLFDDKIISTSTLEIPHPRMHERRFCMEPLNEIVPEWNVPRFNKTVAEITEMCRDKSKITILDVEL